MTLEQTAGEGIGKTRDSVDSFLSLRVMAPLTVIGTGAGAMLGTAGFETNNERLQYAGAAVLCAATVYAVVGATHYICKIFTRGGSD